MALMLAGSEEEIGKTIEERGFMIAQEPAVGSGAMIVALAEAIRDAGFNYQQLLHVAAVDIDRRAVHMAYIQFSLLHIPAIVPVGDSLPMRFYEEAHAGPCHGRLERKAPESRAGREGDCPDAHARSARK
jgi:hypothetical protein